MKRLLITLLTLILASKNAKPVKAKPVPVDCSTTTDAQITENVKAKFAATASLKDQSINVATSGGLVTLTGSVKKGNQKGLATLQAKRVSCVKKVDNQIAVEGAAPKKPTSTTKTSNKNT